MIYYDVSDLVNHSRFTTKVSGIQRVVFEGLKNINEDYRLFFFSPITKCCYLFDERIPKDTQDLAPFKDLWIHADLIQCASSSNIADYLRVFTRKRLGFRFGARVASCLGYIPFLKYLSPSITKLLLKLLGRGGREVKISRMPAVTSDDKLVIFGGVWNFQDCYEEYFQRVPAGVRKIFMLYDMIPIVCPYVPSELRSLFQKYIPFLISNASFIIVNSKSCLSDLVEYSGRCSALLPPTKVVHLAHQLPSVVVSDQGSLRVRRLSSERFALCVGSIESRKNHINLLLVWNWFVNRDQYSNEKLVLAGRWLWDTDQVKGLLEATGNLYGTVVFIEDPTDEELCELYRMCRFTVFPSHYEGWGLPLGESLRFTKPCLHFDVSSLGEAGYGLTTSVPYPDYSEFRKILTKMFIDEEYYRLTKSKIEDNLGLLRSWSDFSREVSELIKNV